MNDLELKARLEQTSVFNITSSVLIHAENHV